MQVGVMNMLVKGVSKKQASRTDVLKDA